MRRYIFHTSRCGSTYTAVKLSASIPTISEPSWSMDYTQHKDIEIANHVESNMLDNQLVKFTSFNTWIAPYLSGRKIFLWSSLRHHMSKPRVEVDRSMLMLIRAPHPKIKHIASLPSDEHVLALAWANRILHAVDCDMLFIKNTRLFSDTEYVCQEMCDYFEVKYVPLVVNIDVKRYGYLHTDVPIKYDNQLNDNNFNDNRYIDVDEDIINWIKWNILSVQEYID